MAKEQPRDAKPRERLDPAKRRQRILRAAQQAFGESPYDAVTIQQVGEASGSSPALIYRYFRSKEHLYVEALEASYDRLRAAQERAMGELPSGVPTRDRVREALRVYLSFVGSQAGENLLPYQKVAGEPAEALRLRAQIRRSYVESLNELLGPHPSLRRSIALWGFLGFLDGAVDQWVREGRPRDREQILLETSLGAFEGALGDWSA